MLPSVRRDIEELETQLAAVLRKQLELASSLENLRAQLTGAMQAETAHLVAEGAERFEARNQWLTAAISQLRGDLLEQGALDKAEIVAAIADSQTGQSEALQTLAARNDELARRMENFEASWREREELEIDDSSEAALRAWSEKVGARLKRFGDSQGMPRSFAWQLLQQWKELLDLDAQFADKEIDWEERLDELERALFWPERPLDWTHLTPHNSTDSQRRELRVLETAVAQLRSHCGETLLRATGIRPLEIVPRLTTFDAKIHESNEFLEVPTDQAQRHNLILSVEKFGFQKISPWGEPRLLRAARVRRYVFREIEPVVTGIENVEAPALSDVPRVSGQL